MFDITTLQGMRIPLTTERILAGVRGAVKHHPIALAVNDVTGECQMCADADSTPIIYHLVPDSIEVHVVFVGGVAEVWEGAGGMGRLDYLTDNDGNVYTTMQALKKRGVRCITPENHHEIEVDA